MIFLYRRQADRFRPIEHFPQHQHSDAGGDHPRQNKSGAPPPSIDDKTADQQNKKRTQIMTGVPQAVIPTALPAGKPVGHGLGSHRTAHGLKIAVEQPKNSEEKKRRTEAEKDVHHRSAEQAHRHKGARIGTVAPGSVDQFGHSVHGVEQREDQPHF